MLAEMRKLLEAERGRTRAARAAHTAAMASQNELQGVLRQLFDRVRDRRAAAQAARQEGGPPASEGSVEGVTAGASEGVSDKKPRPFSAHTPATKARVRPLSARGASASSGSRPFSAHAPSGIAARAADGHRLLHPFSNKESPALGTDANAAAPPRQRPQSAMPLSSSRSVASSFGDRSGRLDLSSPAFQSVQARLGKPRPSSAHGVFSKSVTVVREDICSAYEQSLSSEQLDTLLEVCLWPSPLACRRKPASPRSAAPQQTGRNACTCLVDRLQRKDMITRHRYDNKTPIRAALTTMVLQELLATEHVLKLVHSNAFPQSPAAFPSNNALDRSRNEALKHQAVFRRKVLNQAMQKRTDAARPKVRARFVCVSQLCFCVTGRPSTMTTPSWFARV